MLVKNKTAFKQISQVHRCFLKDSTCSLSFEVNLLLTPKLEKLSVKLSLKIKKKKESILKIKGVNFLREFTQMGSHLEI